MPQIVGTPTSSGTYTPVFVAQDAAGLLSAPVELDITVNTPGGGPVTETMFPLPVFVELKVNDTWTDITEFVYQRDDIHITGGKTDRAGQSSPATMTLTLNNRDGRFTPRFANSPYFPYLQQNTQIRMSLVNATSSSGNTYTGYRFWGEVAEWPPASDISGRDVYVSITASGPGRRVRQGGGEGSALTRYYASLTGSYAPQAYWPCEEDPETTQIGSGVQGGANMVVTTTRQPTWKTIQFNGSVPIGVLNKSTWDGVTGQFDNGSGNDVYDAPGTYQWVASTTTADVRCWGAGGGGGNGVEPGSSGRGGGGGGEFGREVTLAVVPGQAYTVTVGAGGSGGAGSYSNGAVGKAGSDTTFTDPAGVAKTVIGHGGQGGTATGGAGGIGSKNNTHHNGGAGGIQTSSGQGRNGGGGGGEAGGITAAGGAGGNTGGNTGGTGGSGGGAGGNGGAGGDGGFGSPPAETGFNGLSPGGGGGAGGYNSAGGYGRAGGNGSNGQVQIIYIPPSTPVPPANIIRFVLHVPRHGGNNQGVLIRAFTGGTIAKLDCQYRTGGKLRMIGYDGSNATLFDSGNISSGADGQTLMVSMELTASGANVAWALQSIIPGQTGANAKVNGTLNTATVGNVSEILAGPNQDITKTAIAHISLQYARIPLWQVSRALDGHQYEAGPDRFIRLANEEALGNLTEYNEGSDHWGFEGGVQGWTAANATLATSTFSYGTTGFGSNVFQDRWPMDGTQSLLLTANGSGQPSATAPTGVSGQPVQPGDVASLSIDLYAPAQLNNAYVGIKWYQLDGTPSAVKAESDSADTVLPAGQPVTLRLIGKDAVAPSDAQWCTPTFGDHNTDASGTLLYADNVRLAPHMGPQTRKAYREFLQEIEDLDQGILKEAKELFGFKLRTRIRVINQPPSIQLDYTQGVLSPPLAPVMDTQNVKNNIIVHRHKGSKVEVTLNEGQMSILEPPAGVGRYKKNLKAVAAADEQLAALAAHLLNVGTAHDERYPTITVNLARASLPGNALAPLMSAVAGVEIGDMVELDSLPFWYPSTTSQQMVIGYDEVINARAWTITWNCISYTPYIQVTTSNANTLNLLRRW